MNDPLVSIIMPTLNGAAFIREAIDSVLAQDYSPIELIVVDGQSQDATLDILRSFGERIKWISEKDRSLTEAINKGIRLSRGAYVHSLAADESLLPGAVGHFVETMRRTGADVVVGQGYIIDPNSRVVAPIDHDLPVTFNDLLTLKKRMPFAFSMFRRDILDRHPFDEDFIVCQDFMMWLTIFKTATIEFIPQRIGNWRTHPDSWSSNANLAEKVFDARMLALTKLKRIGPVSRRESAFHYAGASNDLMGIFIDNKRRKEALRVFCRSLFRAPFATVAYHRGSLVKKLIKTMIPPRLYSVLRRSPNSTR